MPKLTYADADGASAEHVVRGEPVTIGRGAQCDIRLSDGDVDRLHAMVESSAGKLRLTDQGSRGGTWVNGSRVTDAVLAEGDEFKVGGVSFTVSLGGASTRRSGRAGDGDGDGGEDEEGKSSKRASRRPQREILGGIRLSKTQQTIIKIVCAAIMAMSALGMLWLIDYARNREPVYVYNERPVDTLAAPRDAYGDAVEKCRRAKALMDEDKTREAYEIATEAVADADRAQRLFAEVLSTLEGPGYDYLREEEARMANGAQGIRTLHIRLEEQVKRDEAGGN